MIDQLVDIYLNHEQWHKGKLDKDEAKRYFEIVTKKGRIITSFVGEELAGYVESWRLDYEQWGRVTCRQPFPVLDEDIEHGPVACVANTFIHKKYRRGPVVIDLRSRFFRQNFSAEFFVGVALRKRTEPIKIFEKREAMKKWVQKPE